MSGDPLLDPWVQPWATLAGQPPASAVHEWDDSHSTKVSESKSWPGCAPAQDGGPGTLSLQLRTHFGAMSCRAPPCPRMEIPQISAARFLLNTGRRTQAAPRHTHVHTHTHTDTASLLPPGMAPSLGNLSSSGMRACLQPPGLLLWEHGALQSSWVVYRQKAGGWPPAQMGEGMEKAASPRESIRATPTATCGGQPSPTLSWARGLGWVPHRPTRVVWGSQAGAARVKCGWWTQTTRSTPCCTPWAPETSARTPT